MKCVLAGLVLLGAVSPLLAQTATVNPVSPAVPSVQPVQPAFTSLQAASIKKLLVDGFDVKTGFVDPNGGAYLVLQKATSAFLCHSNPNPTCEKLN